MLEHYKQHLKTSMTEIEHTFAQIPNVLFHTPQHARILCIQRLHFLLSI